MNKYLGFDVGEFHFLLDVAEVVEVFDALASPEPLGQVLVGDAGEVYWRGTLARKLHLGEFLGCDGGQVSCSFVVCGSVNAGGHLYILQVDAIHALHEVDNGFFKPLRINNSRLNAITDQVLIDAAGARVSFLLGDVQRLFLC